MNSEPDIISIQSIHLNGLNHVFKESYRFDSEILNEWDVIGNFSPHITTDRRDFIRCKTGINTDEIDACECVYMLELYGVIVYIGMTINLRGRLRSHQYDKMFERLWLKKFNSSAEIEYMEKLLINMFRPEYNKMHNKRKEFYRPFQDDYKERKEIISPYLAPILSNKTKKEIRKLLNE